MDTLNALIVIRQCLFFFFFLYKKAIDNKLLKKYTKIWEKVLVNIEFDSEPVFGDNGKYIKTKIRHMKTK